MEEDKEDKVENKISNNISGSSKHELLNEKNQLFPFNIKNIHWNDSLYDYYEKYNQDLTFLNEEDYKEHFERLGAFQLRLYFEPSCFHPKKYIIFTTKWGIYISKTIQYLLFKNGFLSDIVFQIDSQSPHTHIILFSQKVQQFPKKFIIYQLEQKDISHWVDKRYETSIFHSIKTWDYSLSNIPKFPKVLQKKMHFFPIPIIPIEHLYIKTFPTHNQPIDVLFYGSPSAYRSNIVRYIANECSRYNIRFVKIEGSLFGEKLYPYIQASKIVLNIHNYPNAILETCRINELLAFKKCVISQKPDIIDVHNYNMYRNYVFFVDSIQEMFQKIVNLLKHPEIQEQMIHNIPKQVSQWFINEIGGLLDN